MGLWSSLILICLLSVQTFGLDTYIVHVELPDDISTNQLNSNTSPLDDLEGWYRSFLPLSKADSSGESASVVYSYRNVFKGFAARLSPEHVQAMEKKPGFISAQPEDVLSLHTTHTPNFLGLHQNMGLWKQSSYGKGVIIGVLDTGIRPDHPSFSDEGMPPPPAKWKGKCEFNSSTACNNKLIGARVFVDGYDSPVDDVGHGTHTASTAAGNYVKGANVYGNANGTAVGVAPLAHLAIYKVCASTGCFESGALAAIDTAIDDGVDILSISLGSRSTKPFYTENIALGAYSAVEKGIFVSCSAGNDGPIKQSLSNEAPWILTVGASTIDRKIVAKALLGKNEELEGQSLYQPIDFPSNNQFPLVYPGFMNASAPYCTATTFANATTLFQGKIVVCKTNIGLGNTGKGENVKAVGGAGMIIINELLLGYTTPAEPHVLPATHLSYADGLKVLSYINSTASPTASFIFKGTIIGDNKAPTIAYSSSRGPNRASPGILKPDITGPGVNIIAAWPNSVELVNTGGTKSTFNVRSGTSMSCPHLSGIAALLKSVHPNWSPATIKSAIMTTADISNLGGNPIQDETLLPADVFAVGSGHVNPARANDPGLVYDIKPEDYVPYLCGLNYTNQQVGKILQRKVNCTMESSIKEAQLNYPSFSIIFGSRNQTYTRTVTNVGEPDSVYVVNIVAPDGVSVTVKPDTLRFSQQNQNLTYEVKFGQLATAKNNTMSQGFLTWNSGRYSVRSPIAAIVGTF